MLASPARESVAVSTADVAAVEALYDQGLLLQAHRRALEAAPLEAWSGTAAALVAGRLAGNIGAPRLARRLHQRAWREDRASAAAACFRAYGLMRERGPWHAWEFLARLPDFPRATSEERADLELARCSVLTLFRDFEEAERHLVRAGEINDHPQPWLWVLRAELCKARDRYPEALAAAEEGVRVQPWYRGAVCAAAEVLPLLGRDAEAVALLQEALRHTECAVFAAKLANLQGELGDHAGARQNWQLFADLSPLMEKEVGAWWHGRMSDAHYNCGDVTAAAEAAARAGTPFFTKLHERLAAPTPAPAGRVLLPVPFVRQHHMTCAPATLSALSTFLGSPIDHLSLARLICYDGTPDHEERHWLQQNGWTVREFRVTWDAAIALLDRGLPFTMVTMETQSAHLQAVIGYDRARGTLLIRDPFERTNGEGFAELLLERYASSGPRGMVLLPAAEGARLDGLDLPDAAEYDRYFQVRRALHEHRRADAEPVLGELHAGSPGHRLTLEAERTLAAYDADHARGLRALELLLERFPKAGHLQYAKLALLRELGHAPEAAAYLRELAQGDEPAFWREWGQHLAKDAREQGRAARWLARSVRAQGLDAASLSALGDLRWTGRDFAQATQLYRHAACLRDKVDGFAQAYLMAARHLRQADRVLELLTQRFEENAARSVQPTRVLFWALSVLDRHPEAFARLEHALTLRPEDGELLLFAADAFGRCGDFERAAVLLAQAKGRSAEPAWLRAAATLADFRCELREALALWSGVLAAEPLAMDAQNFVARLTAETAGRDAARAHLDAQLARFPHHLGLHRLAVEWARASGAAAVQEAVEALLAISPDDAWARRELALTLGGQRRLEEARAQLAQAEALERREPINCTIRAHLARLAGDLPEAREAAREGLRLSVDHTQAMHELLAASESFGERRESIAFIRDELIRQVVLGDGLLTYRNLAFPIQEPPELLAGLREALAARPDLWHAWSATVQQLIAMALLEEALTLATEATERFPLLVPPWLNLARVYLARGERDGQIRPLRRALLIQPACGEAARALATAHEHGDDLEEAQRVLEVAKAAAPLDPENHSSLAALLDKRGRAEAAADSAEHALRLEPGHERGWELLRLFSGRPGCEGRAVQCARSLTELRPAEPQSWLHLAECLPASDLPARLEALDRALALNTRFIEAYDARAMLLAGARRWEEAHAACAPAAWPADQIPVPLRGRRAWIDAERGDLTGAVATMRALLRDEPDFVWGWHRLVEWESQLENFPGALEATVQLCRLAPQNPVPLGWRASLLLRDDRADEALPFLRRAMELDPSYAFASLNLFDQHLRAGRHDEAAEVLARMKLHLPGGKTLGCEVRLHLARRKFEDALGTMRQLCFTREEDGTPVADAGRALVSSGQRQELERQLPGWLTQEGISPEAGALFGSLVAERGGRHAYRALAFLGFTAPAGKRAYLAYMERIVQHRKLDELRRLLKSAGPELRADTELWGQAGATLVQLNQNKEALAWFREWERRPEVPPWILLNVAVVLRRLGRVAESVAASRRALTERPDHTTRLHQLWMATDAFLGERFDEAEAFASAAQFGADGGFYDALREVVNAGVAVQRTPSPDRPRELRSRLERLNQSPTLELLHGGLLKPVTHQALGLMAQLSGERYKARWIRKPASPPATPTNPLTIVRFVFVGFLLLSMMARSCTPERRSSYQPRASDFPRRFATPSYRPLRGMPGPTPTSVFPLSTPQPFEFRMAPRSDAPELRSENPALRLDSPRR